MKIIAQIAIIIFAFSINVFSQEKKINVYSHYQGEVIFSYPNVIQGSEDITNRLRFTAWLHLNKIWHIDFTEKLGLMTGFGSKNIGFITVEDYSVNEEDYFLPGMNLTNIKTKRRSYSLGVPLAFKVGSFKNHFFVFAGGEYEMLFHYKQKHFINTVKYKETEWFSSRTPLFIPSMLIGIQFPEGWQLKLKYYLDDFLNKNYTHNGIRPYAGMKTQLFYLSFSFHLPDKDNIKLKDETIVMRKQKVF